MTRRLLTTLAVLALAACTTETTPEPAAPPTTAPAPPTTPPAPEPEPEPEPITIALAGDVHFEGVLEGLLDDPAPLVAALRPLARADLGILNLETAIGRGGTPEPGKRFVFQAPPSAYDALAAAGVDVVTMANNHALDFGWSAPGGGPPQVVGLGRDADAAFRPALSDVRGTTVATLGATIAGTDPTADPTGHWAATADRPGTADAIDPARLLRAVRAADASADVVVVHVHWGVQGEACPDRRQRTLARRLVDAGADVVAGSHAHRLQGDGRLGPAYVAYGLGNHVWYTADGVSATTGVLTLTVRPDDARVTDAAWTPARIGADGLPAPLPRDERAAFARTRSELRSCAGLAQSP